MKKRGFLNLLVVAALGGVAAGSLYSCKDYDDEMRAEMIEHDSDLQSQIAAQEESLAQLKAELEKMKDEYATKAEVEVLRNCIAEIETALNGKGGLVERIVALETARIEVEKKLETIGERLDKLENTLSVFGTADDIKKLIEDVAETKAKAEANEALAKANENKIGELEKQVAENKQAIAEKEAALKELLNEELKKVNATIDTKVSELQKEIKGVEDKLQAQITDLQNELTALQTQVTETAQALEAMGIKFDNILNNRVTSVLSNGAYSPVVGYFSLPTGLKSNILAAYYGSAEADVHFPTASTVNYVDPTQEVFSPAVQKLLGLKAGQPLFLGGQIIVDSSANNAGKLYVTVNPSSVNMNGKSFDLVNSLDEKASVTLGTAVPSKDKLAFGYTRGGIQQSPNGFYEIPASLSAEQVAGAKLRVEYEELKEAIKDVVTPDDGVDMTNVISTLFACINDIADANAVKVTWKDTLGVHSVSSDYGIAAVAVKPLSYNFMRDYHRDQFWGVDKAYAFVDKLIGKLRAFADANKPNFNFEMQDLVLDDLVLEDLSEDMLAKFKLEISAKTSFVLNQETAAGAYRISEDGKTVEIIKDVENFAVQNAGAPDGAVSTVTLKAQTLNVDGSSVKVNADGSVTVKECSVKTSATVEYDMRPAIEDLYGDINTNIQEQFAKIKADVEAYVKQVNDLMKDLQDYQDKVNGNIDDAINDLESHLNGFIDKVNDKLCKLVNSVNAALQPVMFAKTEKDFCLISGAATVPSVFPSSFVLAPSSYTGEYLAPAAKKFVAVTNVFKGNASAQGGNDDCVKVLQAANEGNADLNAVVPGSTFGIKVQGLKSGYTYEFTYSALDFYGKIANTKCYITVK